MQLLPLPLLLLLLLLLVYESPAALAVPEICKSIPYCAGPGGALTQGSASTMMGVISQGLQDTRTHVFCSMTKILLEDVG
jgi:hypothetical protein